MSAREAVVLKEVLLALGARRDVFVWRQNTFVATELETGRKVRSNPDGTPDVLGSLVLPSGSGLAVGFEVKSASGRLSDEQVLFGLGFSRRGRGLYACVRSGREALALIDAAIADPIAAVDRCIAELETIALRRKLIPAAEATRAA